MAQIREKWKEVVQRMASQRCWSGRHKVSKYMFKGETRPISGLLSNNMKQNKNKNEQNNSVYRGLFIVILSVVEVVL